MAGEDRHAGEDKHGPGAEAVVQAVQALLRTERIVRTYPADHQLSQRAVAEFAPRLAGVLPLDLQVLPDQLVWRESPLLDSDRDRSDLPARLYRDGVRRLHIEDQIDTEELRRFLLALATPIHPDDLSADYVTQLWEAELTHVRLVAIDPYLDLDVPDEVLEGKEVPSADVADTETLAELTVPPPPDEAFHIRPEDAQRVEKEVLHAERCPPWTSFIAAVFDALRAGATAARIVEAVQLLEASFQRLLVEGRIDVASDLLEQMNGPRTPAADLAMCEALDRMAHPEHLEALHKALETGACAPEDAERLLLRFGERTAEPVCALLGQSSGEPMRRFYADLLVKIGAPVLESVVAHLRWPDPELQCHFVRVLGQLRDPCATPELIEVLASEDAAVRRETVRALALAGGETAFETLLSLVLDDPDPSVRVVSLMCLGDARSRLDCEKVLARIKSPEFAGFSSQEKDLLFQALAAAGGVEIIPELRRRLQASWIPGRSENENWRRTAAALAQIGTRAAIEVLDNGAKSRRPELARICGEFLKVAQQERP